MGSNVYLSNINILLGEQRSSYTDIDDFPHILEQHAIPNQPELFGWGNFYQTEMSHHDLIVQVLQQTLDKADIPAEQIDVVLFCSVGFHDGDIYQGIDYQNILERLGLKNAYPLGVTLGGCTMLLGAIHLAKGLVATKNKHVLIVSADKMRDKRFRFQNYAIFSDAAVACLISRECQDGFEIISESFSSMYHPNVNTPEDTLLYQENHQKLLHESGLKNSDFTKVFTNNLFLPVVSIKEGLIGIQANQLYKEGTKRFGHCYSADTLINLATYRHENEVKIGALFLLNATSVTGQRGQIALRSY